MMRTPVEPVQRTIVALGFLDVADISVVFNDEVGFRSSTCSCVQVCSLRGD